MYPIAKLPYPFLQQVVAVHTWLWGSGPRGEEEEEDLERKGQLGVSSPMCSVKMTVNDVKKMISFGWGRQFHLFEDLCCNMGRGGGWAKKKKKKKKKKVGGLEN